MKNNYKHLSDWQLAEILVNLDYWHSPTMADYTYTTRKEMIEMIEDIHYQLVNNN